MNESNPVLRIEGASLPGSDSPCDVLIQEGIISSVVKSTPTEADAHRDSPISMGAYVNRVKPEKAP